MSTMIISVASGKGGTGKTPVSVNLVLSIDNAQLLDCDVVVDSPLGTSCPVIVSVEESDFFIFVTEPTPFGLYDLRLMVKTVKKMG